MKKLKILDFPTTNPESELGESTSILNDFHRATDVI